MFEDEDKLEEEYEDETDEDEDETDEETLNEEPIEQVPEATDLKEASLEEIAESPEQETEADKFSEFMVSSPEEDMPTMTLQPTATEAPEANEDLEELGAASSIGTPIPQTPATGGHVDYVKVYNEPDYSAGTSEETIFDHMSQRRMAARTVEELRNVRPRAVIEDWHEAGYPEQERGVENLRDYVVVEEGTRGDIEGRRLPFEEKRKYRELKRGRGAA